MKKISKIWKKRVALIGIAATLATINLNSCGKKNNIDLEDKVEEGSIEEFYSMEDKVINKVPKDLDETQKVLEKYNSTLEKQGSSIKLTEEDLNVITQNTNQSLIDESLANISLKISEYEYSQADINCFLVETEKKETVLFDIYGIKKDLLTNQYVTGDTFEYLDTLGECILKNNIESIGYAPQKLPECSDIDKEFIISNYGEEVFECLIRNGLPLPLYDVNDFYNLYKNEKDQVVKLELVKKI